MKTQYDLIVDYFLRYGIFKSNSNVSKYIHKKLKRDRNYNISGSLIKRARYDAHGKKIKRVDCSQLNNKEIKSMRKKFPTYTRYTDLKPIVIKNINEKDENSYIIKRSRK